MEKVHPGWASAVAITTSALSFEMSAFDEAFLQVPEGAVQDVEGEGAALVETFGENSSRDPDLGGDYQHQLLSREDNPREEVGWRAHMKRCRCFWSTFQCVGSPRLVAGLGSDWKGGKRIVFQTIDRCFCVFAMDLCGVTGKDTNLARRNLHVSTPGVVFHFCDVFS